MKLNPPASSSDIEVARAIARRLHRRAIGHERATDTPPEGTAVPGALSPPIGGVEPGVAEPADVGPVAPEVSPFESAAFEPAPSEDMSVEPPAPDAAPVEPVEPEAAPFDGPGPFEAAEADGTPSGIPEFSEDPADLPDSPAAEPGATEETPSPSDLWASAAPPPDESAPWEDAAEDGTAPAEIDPDSALAGLGGADSGPALEGLEPPAMAGSPADLVDAAPEPAWPEGGPLEADQEPERAPDDLVSPATPSWDDVADSCLALAKVHGAMLVAPEGQVLAARGSWPEPGPEAIGGRLVAMMEKTLHDAPTRSVSAPLAGQHLTAWRVPASEGHYTVVFMGDAPLGADVRSPVDVEIKRALDQ